MGYTKSKQTVIVTPNRRLALNLRKEFDAAQIHKGKAAWHSCTILPINTWFEKCWRNSYFSKILLNDVQTRFLWNKIIDHNLLNIKSSLEEAKKAYKLLNEWNVSINHPLFNISEDTRIFKNWVKTFDDYCAANNWIEASNIPQELLANNFHIPKKIILAGFDQLTPQINQIINNIKHKGCDIDYLDPNNKASKQILLSYTNQEQEIINMALWAKKSSINTPTANIGCVVPNLTAKRAEIEYVFTKINSGNFDISIGQKLNDFPIINDALNILKSITAEPRSPNGWISYFIKKLQEANWPYADNYPLIVKWQKLLEEFTSLNLVTSLLTSTEALEQLQMLAENTLYQSEQKTAKIKILGTLEAAGINFDYLWIMGLTDKNWPQAPQPHPFIPIELQKQLKMPHSDADRELQYCRILTKRFSRSADNIVFSYATQGQDEIVNASPIIKSICSRGELVCSPCEPIYSPCELETLIDNKAPPLQNHDQIKGGSKIFKLQSACPFRAFAECRLGAQEPEQTQPGLNARERGLLVHEILEKIWQTIVTHEQLLSYSDETLTSMIQKTVHKCLINISKNKPEFAKLESKRLEKLLTEWMAIEKNRTPFTVLAQEQEQSVTLSSSHKIPIRIDRVDQLKDGSLLLIDYKTGQVSTKGWFDERPDDPQLPLYCVSSKNPIDGIAFAQIKPGNLKFKGKTKTKNQLPDVKHEENWVNLVNNWRIILEKLGKDFCFGNAKVDPKDEKTCTYCKLRGFCRIKTEAVNNSV